MKVPAYNSGDWMFDAACRLADTAKITRQTLNKNPAQEVN